MQRETIGTGPSVEEAIDVALEELGVQQDAVEYEVLEEGGRRVFGIGSDKPARVRVWIKASYLDSLSQEDADDEAEEELPAELVVDEAAPELSDEELDRVADTAVQALKSVLATFGIDDPTIEEYEGDDGEIILDVMGGDLGLLIGRHGRTLDSLQSVVAAISTRQLGYRYPIVVDVEGYRHRRRQKIEEMAKRSADRAARQRVPVKMRPMTAYERRVVHVALRNDGRVETASEGVDPFRQVVIKPRRR